MSRRTAVVVAAVALLAALAPARPARAAATPVYFDVPGINGVSIHACRLGDDTRPRPVVLEWTNYNIDDPNSRPAAGCPPQFGALAGVLVQRGYIYVAGQTRGVGASTGVADFWSTQDGRDGAMLIEWIARQPWSDGHVGLAGCSSSAMEGMQVAVDSPPHLDAVVMSCMGTDAYRDSFYPGGVRSYASLPVASRPLVDLDPLSLQARIQAGDPTLYPESAMRIANDAAGEQGILSQTDDTAFWQDRSTWSRLGSIRAPMLVLGNWADFFLRGTFEWERHRKPGDRLVLLPGWHGDSLLVPGPYGMTARATAWFDSHLRGLPDPYAAEPPTVYWEQPQGFDPAAGRSGNEPVGHYLAATAWPPPGTHYATWRLDASPPPAVIARPSGSPGATTDMRGFGLASMNPPSAEFSGAIVTSTTAPVAAPMHLAGPVTATIWVTPAAADLDLYVRLLDVAPDGAFHELTNGWLRGAHRAVDPAQSLRDPASGEVIRPWHPHDSAVLLTPGTPTEMTVELWETAAVVPAGDSVRLFVAAEDVPWFVQDAQAGGATVLADAAHPSRVVLPVTTSVTPAPRVTGPVLAAPVSAAPATLPDTASASGGAAAGIAAALAVVGRRRARRGVPPA